MLKDDTFFERLDAVPYLIGFDNGVYDLNEDRFREGYPDDMISMTTGYDFTTEDNDTVDYDIKKKLISAIFEDADTCIYTLKIYAACLYGSRKFEEFYLLTGVSTSIQGLDLELMLYIMSCTSILLSTSFCLLPMSLNG